MIFLIPYYVSKHRNIICDIDRVPYNIFVDQSVYQKYGPNFIKMHQK